MIRRLFRGNGTRTPTPGAPAPSAPGGSRIYAVGDIHGRADLLESLHESIRRDAAESPPSRKVLIYLGDYVDRGAQSSDVIEMLVSAPLRGFETVHLCGNHEAWMLDFLEDPGHGTGWMLNGGSATLLSYGVSALGTSFRPDRLAATQRDLREKLPEAHLAFLASLELSHTEGDYFFTHAGIRPGIPLDAQSAEDLVWIRDEFLYSDRDHGKFVVHGHTIVDAPEALPNRIGIDTGAFATGRLTCLVLEGTERRFISTRQ